jgi:hypothetical protein
MRLRAYEMALPEEPASQEEVVQEKEMPNMWEEDT